MSTGNRPGATAYPDTMSTQSESQTPWQRWRGAKFWTPGTIAFLLAIRLVQGVTGWSRWVFWVPAVAVSAAILAYYWAKSRRSEAPAGGS